MISRRMAVLGCQSGKALRRFAKSSLKKWATPSFAIKSRNAQGIYIIINLENSNNNRRASMGRPIDGSLRNHSVLYWRRNVGLRVPGARSNHDPSEKGN